MKNFENIVNEIIKSASKVKVILIEYKRSTKTNQKNIQQIAKKYDGEFVDWFEKDYGIESEWTFSNSTDANSFIVNVKKIKNIDADIER